MNGADWEDDNFRKSLVERVNERIDRQLDRIDEIESLGDILKLYGIEDIRPGRIQIGNRMGHRRFRGQGEFRIRNEVFDAVLTLDKDYDPRDISRKFHTEHNTGNPYRVEVTFEKQDGVDGAIEYIFGQWIQIPRMHESASLDETMKMSASHLPKIGLLVARPEELRLPESAIVKFFDQYGKYGKITHLRFGNDFKIPGYGALELSLYGPNLFTYIGTKAQILHKWGFLIPGLKDSFR